MPYWLKIEDFFRAALGFDGSDNGIRGYKASSADVREAVNGADREYPDFVWTSVPVNGDRYLVAAEAKPKPLRGVRRL